jgi:hypothetical protein
MPAAAVPVAQKGRPLSDGQDVLPPPTASRSVWRRRSLGLSALGGPTDCARRHHWR